MWKGVKEFFTYTKKQRNGLLVLVLLVIGMQAYLYFDDFFIAQPSSDFSQFDSIVAYRKTQITEVKEGFKAQDSLFFFDPNEASVQDFTLLGLDGRVSKSIINYRTKGGQFRKKEDVLKIYNMDSAWYFRVSDFIVINTPAKKERDFSKKNYSFKSFDPNTVSKKQLEKMGLRDWQAKNIITYREKVKPFAHPEQIYKVYGIDSALAKKMIPFVNIELVEEEKPVEEVVIINLNTADSLALLSLKGIGPAYAHRILEYREKLGGFVSTTQLMEVYGMDEERMKMILPFIEIHKGQVRKLSLNTSSFKELLSHPYLNYEVVKNIVNFRDNVRPYESVDELKQIELIDDVLFSKIAPYLRL